MRKNISFVLAAFTVFCACGTADRGAFEDPSPHFLAIESSRKAKPVDFARIASTYDEHLADFVRSRDSAADASIVRAISDGKQQRRVHVQSQVVSKTLQKVMLHEIIAALRGPGPGKDSRSRQAEERMLEGYYACLSPTVVRRSEWIGRGRELDELVWAHMESLREEAHRERAAADIEKTLVGVFALSVLYELEGIEGSRGEDSLKCEEKQAEARLFFEAIRSHAGGDSLGNALGEKLRRDCRELDIVGARHLTREAFADFLPSE
jgi:hypothetical protein